jgi:NAD(P)-dependent dehydrogenase (short-subunit alcohol dehydrogenase family)
MSVLLVTGGGRGIGAATCLAAAKAGWDVAVNYARDDAAAARVVAAVEAMGRKAVALKADVADPAAIVRLFDDAAGLGPLSGVVVNAGITGRMGRVDDDNLDNVRAVIETNVWGAYLTAREAAKRLSTRNGGPGGAVVTTGSAASTLGSPGEFVWYAASKGWVDTMTIGLAKELAKEGVRVNAVSPGLIDTEIHASSGEPGRAARLAPMVPMGRIGGADEVADAIVWLLSDGARYVTGQILRVSGGR